MSDELKTDVPKSDVEDKPSIKQQLAAAWPMALVAVGGLIGGLLGGLAYAINLQILKKDWSMGAKIAANIGVGLTAVGIWLVIAIAIGSFS